MATGTELMKKIRDKYQGLIVYNTSKIESLNNYSLGMHKNENGVEQHYYAIPITKFQLFIDELKNRYKDFKLGCEQADDDWCLQQIHRFHLYTPYTTSRNREEQMNRLEKQASSLGFVPSGSYKGMNFFSKGGIPNNYAGKTAQQVWDAWDIDQRTHFLEDHLQWFDLKGKLTPTFIVQHNKIEWKILPEEIKEQVKYHVKEGQYARGGKTGGSGWGNYNKGERIHSFKGLKKGDILLVYSPQFDANNVVRITDMRENDIQNKGKDRHAIVSGKFVDPNDTSKTRKWADDSGFSIWDHDLKHNEYYLPDGQYARGGTLQSAWKRFINWCNEEI